MYTAPVCFYDLQSLGSRSVSHKLSCLLDLQLLMSSTKNSLVWRKGEELVFWELLLQMLQFKPWFPSPLQPPALRQSYATRISNIYHCSPLSHCIRLAISARDKRRLAQCSWQARKSSCCASWECPATTEVRKFRNGVADPKKDFFRLPYVRGSETCLDAPLFVKT